MSTHSQTFDNSQWAHLDVGAMPINQQRYVEIHSTGDYSLAPHYTTKLVQQLDANLFKWRIDTDTLKITLDEYFSWLYYVRIQDVTKEGPKVIDPKSNQIVVPSFMSAVLERIGLAYSPNQAVLLKPKYVAEVAAEEEEKTIFKQYSKTPDEARAFIISTGSKLRAMMEEAGLPFTTSITKEQVGDFETMALAVMKTEELAKALESSNMKVSFIGTAGTRAIGEDNPHPVCGIFASMLGVRQIERTLQPVVWYDSFDVMQEQLLKAVTCVKQNKPRTVPRDRTARHGAPRDAGSASEGS